MRRLLRGILSHNVADQDARGRDGWWLVDELLLIACINRCNGLDPAFQSSSAGRRGIHYGDEIFNRSWEHGGTKA